MIISLHSYPVFLSTASGLSFRELMDFEDEGLANRIFVTHFQK